MSALDETTPADVAAARPSTMLTLGHRFLDDLPELCEPWRADIAPAPALVVLNETLSAQLGLDVDALRSPHAVDTLVGNDPPMGAEPVAMGYAGHQFGNYSPRLGDGRALLLGELTAPNGALLDVHLKGCDGDNQKSRPYILKFRLPPTAAPKICSRSDMLRQKRETCIQ